MNTPTLSPEPPQNESGPPADSLTTRLRASRRARQNEKILQEKELEEKAAPSSASPPGTGFLERAGELFSFIGQFFARFWRRPFEFKELLKQMDEVGSKSLLLTGVVGFSIGIVLAMQSRGTLARFGAESFLPSMLALSVFKEIGPVLTSLVLAGRLGAGMGAELGSMRVTEQIDALDVAVTVYDLLGRAVVQPIAERLGAGAHRADVSMAGLAPGVYVVRLSAGSRIEALRLTVAR